MKLRLAFHSVVVTLSLALAPAAIASSTWYVDGVHGSNHNNCMTQRTACKTIGHAIWLASSGDSIMVAAATYKGNLVVGISLKVIGSGAATTIIDGGQSYTVVTIPRTAADVTFSDITITHGVAVMGAGIFNDGTLTLFRSSVIGNEALHSGCAKGSYCPAFGGGIYSNGTLVINSSTVAGNSARASCYKCGIAQGGGIFVHRGAMSVIRSTVNANVADSVEGIAQGGGIISEGTTSITNSTISGNTAYSQFFNGGGGISNDGTVSISNSTIAGNGSRAGGGIVNVGTATLQNTILANSTEGGNCSGTMTSAGYNLSSDATCNFNGTGDMNNTDPKLGTLGNYGGPTQTIPLLSGRPAIDAGNPNGCTDGNGRLLKTDQRGKARPDHEDKNGCDMGAYERQRD